MGRHEIRFRRQRMTSRRMERHKNYQEILSQHKSRRRVRIARLVLYILAFLVLMLVLLFGLGRLGGNSEDKKPVSMEKVQMELLPNVSEYGIAKKSKT